MSESTIFHRQRSAFWLRINENDDGSCNFFASKDVSPVIKYHFPKIEDLSPLGWRNGKKNTENAWIPRNRSHQIDLGEIKGWAQFAGNQCVWLKLGKPLRTEFRGSELDSCIAADFNFQIGETGTIGQRSPLGEAEWKLKYHYAELSDESRRQCLRLLSRALQATLDLLPLRCIPGSPTAPIVSPVPSQGGATKLAWAAARHLAQIKELPLAEPRLIFAKPEMKHLSVQKKAQCWADIYATPGAIALDAAALRNRDIIVVDDLYQSGITMWAYARYLKSLGARRVYGLTCVKSMKDSDNQ